MSIYKEFEIRLLLSPSYKESPFTHENYKLLIEHLINYVLKNFSKIELKNTVNLIEDIIKFEEANIMEVVYKSDSDKKEHKYIKKILRNKTNCNINNRICYKSSLSTEKDDPDMYIDMNNISIVRGKQRISVNFDESLMKNWRLDITFIKHYKIFKNNLSCIKDIKKNLFNNIYDIKDFKYKNVNWNYISSVEIEIEYEGPQNIDFYNLNYTQEIDYITNILLQNEQIHDNILYLSKLHELSQVLEKKIYNLNFKNLVNNVKNLTNISYRQFVLNKIHEFFVTIKLDGERVLLIYENNKLLIISNNGLKIVTDFIFKNDDIKYFILDCELYNENYYVFDLLKINNISYTKANFIERYTQATQLVNSISHDKIKLKIFYPLNENNYCDVIKDVYKNSNHKIDGLIFTQIINNYNYTDNYKWKPIEDMSIDFLIVKCPEKLIGQKPYINKPTKTLYLLFTSISMGAFRSYGLNKINEYDSLFPSINQYYFPIQFSPFNNVYAYLCWMDRSDLHMKIVELIFNKKTNEWELLKIRIDKKINLKDGKDIGNNFDTACEIWYNYDNPLSLENLCYKKDQYEENIYFTKTSETQTNARKYNRFVSELLLKPSHDNNNWIVDIGIGRGADINRYINYKYKNLLGIDKDIEALKELVERYKFYIKKNKNASMKLFIQELDLTKCGGSLEQLELMGIMLPKKGVDLIFCNFAFHYFLYNDETLDNVLCFISSILKHGGKFIFTVFDGENIFNLLKNKKIIEFKNIDGVIEYAIEKKYEQNDFLGVGQLIGVLQPFTNGKFYDEPLVNISHINKIASKKYKMNLIDSNTFSKHLDDYDNFVKNIGHNNLLSDIDKKYIDLYKYYIFLKS